MVAAPVLVTTQRSFPAPSFHVSQSVPSAFREERRVLAPSRIFSAEALSVDDRDVVDSLRTTNVNSHTDPKSLSSDMRRVYLTRTLVSMSIAICRLLMCSGRDFFRALAATALEKSETSGRTSSRSVWTHISGGRLSELDPISILCRASMLAWRSFPDDSRHRPLVRIPTVVSQRSRTVADAVGVLAGVEEDDSQANSASAHSRNSAARSGLEPLKPSISWRHVSRSGM